MASDELREQLNNIIEAAEQEEARIIKPVQQEEKKNSEEEGVEKAAESLPQEADSNAEGQEPSETLDEDLKNIDPELREVLSKADAEIRKAQVEAFKKMRANFDRKQTELGNERKIAEKTKQLFSSYGLDSERGFSQIEKLINLEKALEKNPTETINKLQAIFNITPSSGSEKNKQEDVLDESDLTNEERILYRTIKQTEETNRLLLQKQADLERRLKEREIEEIRLQVESFKNAKNEDGSLRHPYFEELTEDIGRLTDLYPTATIDVLYNKALRLNDEIYNRSLEDAKINERNRLLSEKEKALNKAKNLNSQSLKSSNQSTHQTLDDILFGILEQADKK